jgi:hypothetical protein
MTGPIVETARISLRPGVTRDDLIAASARFQAEFLSHYPGFLRRELLDAGDGSFLDLVHWADRATADGVIAQAMASPACQAYFALMEMSDGDPSAGVTHYQSLATYPGR